MTLNFAFYIQTKGYGHKWGAPCYNTQILYVPLLFYAFIIKMKASCKNRSLALVCMDLPRYKTCSLSSQALCPSPTGLSERCTVLGCCLREILVFLQISALRIIFCIKNSMRSTFFIFITSCSHVLKDHIFVSA